ncbi:hypothetical protein FRX31_032389 [Thalictrum thalictroides]|uniref:Uncharacterized protein n=1 Tax=Thalictrum thalictroides TaxID=46969 RepID=A0A7J6V0Y0_THATH|nr:hypothetical protein FRX31_032389 [Thalictrum thalictroides]
MKLLSLLFGPNHCNRKRCLTVCLALNEPPEENDEDNEGETLQEPCPHPLLGPHLVLGPIHNERELGLNAESLAQILAIVKEVTQGNNHISDTQAFGVVGSWADNGLVPLDETTTVRRRGRPLGAKNKGTKTIIGFQESLIASDEEGLDIVMNLLARPFIANLLMAHGVLVPDILNFIPIEPQPIPKPSPISTHSGPFSNEIEGYVTRDTFGGTEVRGLSSHIDQNSNGLIYCNLLTSASDCSNKEQNQDQQGIQMRLNAGASSQHSEVESNSDS